MKPSSDARWDQSLALIRKNVTEQIYNTWFKPIVFEQFDEAQKMILVQVPSPFVYEYLEENFVDLLSKVLHRCFGQGIGLKYRVVTDKEHNLSQDIEADPTDVEQQQKPRTKGNQSPSILDAAQPQQIDSQLNPHLTFNNYIEGDSNKLPRSVGMSIAEHPNTMAEANEKAGKTIYTEEEIAALATRAVKIESDILPQIYINVDREIGEAYLRLSPRSGDPEYIARIEQACSVPPQNLRAQFRPFYDKALARDPLFAQSVADKIASDRPEVKAARDAAAKHKAEADALIKYIIRKDNSSKWFFFRTITTRI